MNHLFGTPVPALTLALALGLGSALAVSHLPAWAQATALTNAPGATPMKGAPTAGTPQVVPADAAVQAAIRKTLGERYPSFPKIDEISRTAVSGLFEVRYGGTEIVYSDATGDHLIQGSIIDTLRKADLTEMRVERLLAVDFNKLPLKEAIVIKQGTGARKLAVFVDPNCGYCKQFERELAGIKDVTIYNLLLPILGEDSVAKARNVYCAKEPAKVWRAWMLNTVVPSRPMGKCDPAALDRILAFARQHKITGTPAVFFEDGTRKPGALPAESLERLLATAAAATRTR